MTKYSIIRGVFAQSPRVRAFAVVRYFECELASSRRSVSWGRSAKNAARKKKKACFFFFFSRAVLCAAPQLTERLEEAKCELKELVTMS